MLAMLFLFSYMVEGLGAAFDNIFRKNPEKKAPEQEVNAELVRQQLEAAWDKAIEGRIPAIISLSGFNVQASENTVASVETWLQMRKDDVIKRMIAHREPASTMKMVVLREVKSFLADLDTGSDSLAAK